MSVNNACPLCLTPSPALFYVAPKGGWKFFRCEECDLIFKDQALRLAPSDEKARYLTHENDVKTPGYVEFLTPVVEQVKEILPVGEVSASNSGGGPIHGLDFGCGPGPVLAELLEQNGFQMKTYDPYFAPNTEALKQKYDFITCTEVAEHFHNPREEFQKLTSLLEIEGTLFVLTQMHDDVSDFPKWYYWRDPTHVCFYGQRTFRWIAQAYGFAPPEFASTRLSLLRRQFAQA